MTSIEQDFTSNVSVLRDELRNIRKQIDGLKHQHKKEVAAITKLITSHAAASKSDTGPHKEQQTTTSEPVGLDWSHIKPVGYVKSVFKTKNGTPRQSGVVPSARATLTLLPDLFTNPQHSLDGLHQFSHVWIIFVFHQNKNNYTKAKVQPPRLNGAKTGLFATRCPYRPNPIGLSLVKLDAVKGSTLHLSGVDLVNGTPVLDIKPYIPQYDQPVGVPMSESSTVQPPGSTSELHNNTFKSENDTSESGDETFKLNYDTRSSEEEDSMLNSENSASKQRSKACDSQNSMYTCQNKTFEKQSVAKDQGCKIAFQDGTGVHQDIAYELQSNAPKDQTGTSDVVESFKNDVPCETTQSDNTEGTSGQTYLTRALDVTYTRSDPKEVISTDMIGSNNNNSNQSEPINVAKWVSSPPINKLSVCFTKRADDQLRSLNEACDHGALSLEYLRSCSDAREAIASILSNDPRSTYRRNKCSDKLYYFNVDVLHVTCWFDDDLKMAEVLKIKW